MPIRLVMDDSGKISHVKRLAASAAMRVVRVAIFGPDPLPDEGTGFPPSCGFLHVRMKAAEMPEFRRWRSADLLVAVTILDVLG